MAGDLRCAPMMRSTSLKYFCVRARSSSHQALSGLVSWVPVAQTQEYG